MEINQIGRYEVIRELGRGGMAAVFLARDPAFERQVAVKVLPPQLTRDAQYLARFKREARLIASLEHAYIVPVYDYGEQDGQPFLVMRYMSGGTLADRMGGQPMPPATVASIVIRIAEALDEAHHLGIVHRDLKPTNVLFDGRGQPYLSDFGIAKILEETNTTSLTGSSVVGTPAYMSPEQALGEKKIDHHSDVYSLGVMIYEMLTGRHPYQGDTPMRVLLKHISDPPPTLDINELQKLGLGLKFNDLLHKALAKKPDERFNTATELASPLASLSRFTQEQSDQPGRGLESPWPTNSSSRPTLQTPRNLKPTHDLNKGPSSHVAKTLAIGGGIGLLVMGALIMGAFIGQGFRSFATSTWTPTVTQPPTVSASETPTVPRPTWTSTETLTPFYTATATDTDTSVPTMTQTSTRRPTRVGTAIPPTATDIPPIPTTNPPPNTEVIIQPPPTNTPGLIAP